MIGVIGTVIGCYLTMVLPVFILSQHISERATLVAVRSINGIDRSFTLMLTRDGVGAESYYQLYVRNANGSITLLRIEANSLVKIFEDKDLRDGGYWVTTKSACDTVSLGRYWVVCRSSIVSQEFEVLVGSVYNALKAH
ncbi:MAG: hypothetical protein P4L53_04765 [Candidatus Obscuribacterales bacterium]|nr:hypothetical protein [Candidatus Obscuribacterales bacterium]